MARNVCYIDDEGHVIVCTKEMMGETFLDCDNCEEREEHEKFNEEMRDVEERKNISKKLIPLFKGGVVKAYLESEFQDNLEFVKVHFDDEGGKKRVLEEIEKMSKRQKELFSKMSVPEKMRAYGFTFDSLANAYSMMCSRVVDLEKRIELIDAMDGKTCMCSAMGLEDGKNAVPYLYCIILEGADRLPSKEDIERNPCLRCGRLRHGCSKFVDDPEYDTSSCLDYLSDKDSKYSSPCAYFKPSDKSIEKALDLHEIHFCEGKYHHYIRETDIGYEIVKPCRDCPIKIESCDQCIQCGRDCIEVILP